MPELPTTFGKYFLTEKLATGGMAEIYLGKIVGPGGFEKQLVIKQIHPKLSGQRHFVDLFVAEAKTLVSLAHGNIVPVFELGVVDDTYFIAMDYIDGPTLYRMTEALARRDVLMKPAVAAWIAARILEGLDYAHRKGEGVIHRDLSPRNVMLSRDGEVKLVDFGIAVTLGAAGDEDAAQSAPTGSFPYMSPEQVRKEPLSGQSDLFSVGVLLWEMLVGQRLFARNDPDATLAAVGEMEIPRPSAERPEVPIRLDDVVMRALQRDKTERWATAAEMLGALQRYLYALEETPTPRDVEALVARYCPPETRRLPTHAESPSEGAAEAGVGMDATQPRAERGQLAHTDRPPPAGPQTAVIERDQTQPRGKRPTRQKSFATHVQLQEIIERGTPLYPIQAIQEPATAPPTPAATAARGRESPATTMRIPGRDPGRGLLVILGLGASALAVAAVLVFMAGRDGVLRPDAGPRNDDASSIEPDAESVPPPFDASSPPDATPADAPTVPIDAGRQPTDAALHPRPDAGVVSASRGTATLKIGADPWADIVIDGASRGRTPQTIVMPAGRHVIELVYGGEDPPKKKTFPLDLTNGDTRDVYEDFSKP